MTSYIDSPGSAPTPEQPAQHTRVFPIGTSNMAGLVRQFDWSRTNLGSTNTWPQSLRTIVDFMLQSPLPMITLLGTEGIMIYNDAYSIFAGNRHPRILGRKVLEEWPEIAYFNQHILDVGLRGETLSYHNQHLVLERNGVPEDAWLDLNYSPVFDDSGSPMGVMAIVVETTERVLEEQRRKQVEERFQLALNAGTLVGTWVWEIPIDQVTVDARFARYFSIDPVEGAKGLPISVFTDSMHPEDQERVGAAIGEALAKGGPYRAEYRVLHADGRYRWVEATGHCDLAEDGSPLRFPGVLIDISERKQAGELHKRTTERLQLALDAAGTVGVIEYDLSTNIMYADTNIAKIFAIDPQKALQGLPPRDFMRNIHPDDISAVEQLGTLSVEREGLYSQTYRLIDQDGNMRWVYARGNVFDDENGQPTRFAAVIIDITEQKLVEAALRESQSELKLITDELPELVGYVDTTLTYRFANRAYEQWFGLPREQIIGRTMYSITDTETFAVRKPWVERALAGEEVRFEAALDMNGQRRDTELRFFPRRAVDGTVEGTYIFVIDISDRKRAEAALRQLNQGLEQQIEQSTRERNNIWNLSQDMLGIADSDGIWSNINPAWQHVLGWPQEEIVGRTSEWMEHPDDLLKTRAEVQYLAAGNHTLYFENRFRTSQGTYRWLSWSAVPQDGLLYCVARDVTEEKERQNELERVQEQLRQAQKMEAIGQLTGGIAHDFNNLLTGIISSMDLLQRRVTTGRTADLERYINIATTSAKRAAALTHRLLAFSRRQSLDVRPLDVNNLIFSLEDLLRRTMGESIAFETALKAGVWSAMTDANQFENALLNLCINARDAMPNGGKLTVETANTVLDETYTREFDELESGDYVVVCVSDTGSGMAPDVIARAFDPFFTTKPIGQGTGLGLSMIYGFAKQSGGHIRIYSEVGQGTTVKLYLPRNPAEIEAAQALEAGERLKAGANEYVLVVEDDAAVRMVIMEVLADLGYRATEASDATTALPFVQSDVPIDLLISDVGLPGMNGRQLAEVVHQHRPELPILFVTGYAEGAAVRGDFLAAGMDLISKPFSIDVLAAKIHSMLAKR